MATVTRQPFAPLDGTRLQNLTSLKNRQNAIASPAGKRKAAELIDVDDFENVDPNAFAKRSKGSNTSTPSKDFFKPSNFVLKATAPAPAPAVAAPLPDIRSLASPSKRRTLQPRSPAAKLNTGITKSSPIHTPAGRSPTRSKRSGLLSSRRRTVGPYTRVDPPRFSLGSEAPFSLDAALKGTIAGYGAPKPAVKEDFSALNEPEMKASWFFEIHEDTPEQEMTNLLQHSTCTLDISSDEESERKASREKAEGRDKENIPPVDDVSQTSARRSPRQNIDDMVVEKERVALGEMNTADYFAEGCDETSVIIIPADDDEQPEQPLQVPVVAPAKDFKFAPETKPLDPTPEPQQDIDTLMAKSDEGSTKAAVLEPIEGTGESFELWESGSAKDETEPATALSS
ncbi:Fc.00g046570.m01.CDS01 [Cosmosporella sp. VM-42]